MKRIGEVHPLLGPIERLREGRRVLNRDLIEADKSFQRGERLYGLDPEGAPQRPFGFQQSRRGDKDALAVDQRSGSLRLLAIVGDEVANDNVRINCEHGGAALRR